jgi:YD repeat-containing protein
MFGANWRSSYEERVFVGSDGSMKYARGDGSFWSFALDTGAGVWRVVAPANGGVSMAQGSTNWTMTFKSGETRTFDVNSGSLTAIIDRNGNTTALSYDGLNRLTTVTDAASRHLYFTYGDTSGNYTYQVTSVTSDVGIALSYSYGTYYADIQFSPGQNPIPFPELVKVTKPDQTTVSFEYIDGSAYCISWPVVGSQPAGATLRHRARLILAQNRPSCDILVVVQAPQITAVKDSNGKILEQHTYAGLAGSSSATSSRANGVEAVTVH